MAITAWAANVSSMSICCFVNGSTRVFHRLMTPMTVRSRTIGAARKVR